MAWKLRPPLTSECRKIHACHKLNLYQSPKAFDQRSLSFCLSLCYWCEGTELVCNVLSPSTGGWGFLLPWVLLASTAPFYSSPLGLPAPGSLFNQDITFYRLWPTAEGKKTSSAGGSGLKCEGTCHRSASRGQMWMDACWKHLRC